MAGMGPNWIMLVLPYLEEQALRDSFDPKTLKAPYTVSVTDPGTGNANITARGTEIPSLLCPSDPYNRIRFTGYNGNWARTNYAASAGRAFIYPPAAATPGMDGTLGPLDSWVRKDGMGFDYQCMRGVMGPNASVTMKQITDGTSKTIMLGEIRAGLNETDGRGIWAFGHAGASLVARYGGGGDDDGPNSAYSNGDDVPSPGLGDAAGVCVARTNSISLGEGTSSSGGSNYDQATIRSKHPGGVHIAYADGRVDFLSDDIETTGCYSGSSCCTAWDYLILSADEGRLGLYNGAATGRGATTPCN
jgi:prepilin-type processing-associated H-X9-DG protein